MIDFLGGHIIIFSIIALALLHIFKILIIEKDIQKDYTNAREFRDGDIFVHKMNLPRYEINITLNIQDLEVKVSDKK